MDRSLDSQLGAVTVSQPTERISGVAQPRPESLASRTAKRGFDVVVSAALLTATAPLTLTVAALIALESRGGVFYRCHRVGFHGRPLVMLKFRKMHADARGSALTLAEDDRFTRIGRVLAATKLDELPQLWNVLRGDMSLVGPRPEDQRFVDMHPEDYALILSVRPGVSGLTQLAFARESEILDPDDREGYYIRDLLPQKVRLDVLYSQYRTFWLDLKVLFWTAAAVVVRRDVAVNRVNARISMRASKHTANDRRRP